MFLIPHSTKNSIPYKIEITSSNIMKGVSFLATVAILAMASSFVSAYDPSPLQDFCVAINDIKSGGMYKKHSSVLLAVVVLSIKFF